MDRNVNRYDSYAAELNRFQQESRLRKIPQPVSDDDVLDLTSNDYMGLQTQMKALSQEFMEKYHSSLPSFSASASRLLCTSGSCHNRLESLLESWYGRPALLFNSGYHANTGIISALNIPGTLFVADKLIHASMIDGLRMGNCKFLRFPHNDLDALEKIVTRHGGEYERIVVLTESIYSMDGDMAPLERLVALRRKYPNIILYVDEAHALGVRGNTGLGLAEELGLTQDIDILIGTMGKAVCSAGAFCIADSIMKEYLVNTARSFIFSTALPPLNMAWSIDMLTHLREADNQRRHLRELSLYFRRQLRDAGYNVPEGDTPIVPLLTGDAAEAVRLSRWLAGRNILVLPIRRPTVPPGGERLRFSINASLTFEDIDKVVNALKQA